MKINPTINVTKMGITKIGITGAKALGTFQVTIHFTKYPTAGPIIKAPKNPAGVAVVNPAMG